MYNLKKYVQLPCATNSRDYNRKGNGKKRRLIDHVVIILIFSFFFAVQFAVDCGDNAIYNLGTYLCECKPGYAGPNPLRGCKCKYHRSHLLPQILWKYIL